MCAVAAASALEKVPAHGSLTRPNIVSVGTIIWLSSELMFFAALFAMYFTTRSVNGAEWPPADVHLNVRYSLVFTIILVLSSFTCQMGVFAAERGDRRGMTIWYVITFLMGLTFILGQGNEYRTLINEGMTISAHPYGSVFFLTTGFHGLHVCGGLVAFILVLLRAKFVRNYTPKEATSAIVVSYYWHFVDVVWIALYATIYVIQ